MLTLELSDKPQPKYSEIGQQLKVKFGFANKIGENHYKAVHHLFNCRDFLGDSLFAEETNQSINIYQFQFDPTMDKIDKDKTRLMVKYPFINTAKKNLPILYNIEAECGFTPTIIASDGKLCLIEGDPRWQSKVFLISLYSYLLKCLAVDYENPDNWMQELMNKPTNEGHYLNNVGINKFKKILSNIGKISELPDGVAAGNPESVYQVHESYGWLMSSCYDGGDQKIVKLLKAA